MHYKRVRVYRCIFGLILLFLLLGYAVYFGNRQVQAISFSAESGFYDEEFYLEINATQGAIYYTLDSSDPTENSLVYTEPILIKDASDNKNKYSVLTDVCLEFNEELKTLGTVKDLTDSGYSIPEHPVDKATVVKAICIDQDGNCSDIITGVYFVGFSNKSGYDNIHIVSVVTDPDNLFGYENGIYVAGKQFEDYYARVDSLEWCTIAPANYWTRGVASERAASITIWNTEKKKVSYGTFDIKIQGKGSRFCIPKNLKICETDTPDSNLNGAKLGFSSDIDNVILFAGSQDQPSKLKNYLVSNMCEELNITVRDFIPCELFLDGEYWGTYYLYESLEPKFFENHYDVFAENVEYVKNGLDSSMYNTMVNFISTNDMAIPENYLRAQEVIDMDSCIDYFAVEIYIANHDWLPNNYGLWRTKSLANEMYSDTKWRWVLFDADNAMANANRASDDVSWAINHDSAFASLMENEEFESALYDRLIYLAENVFYPSDVDAFIDNYETEMAGPMQNDYQRFYENRRTMDDFYNGCEDVKKFFHQRYDYIMETYGGENE